MEVTLNIPHQKLLKSINTTAFNFRDYDVLVKCIFQYLHIYL